MTETTLEPVDGASLAGVKLWIHHETLVTSPATGDDSGPIGVAVTDNRDIAYAHGAVIVATLNRRN